MANGERGEIEIELGGTVYLLVPSNKAFCEIEDKLNCSILEVFERYQEKKPRFKDMAAIFWACSKDMTFDMAGELVRKYGMGEFSLPCLQVISKALTGENKKKVDEAQQSQESPG